MVDGEFNMIRFKELSWPLKAAVVSAWVFLIFCVVSFVAGFMVGLGGG